jgi:hypothetical protein
MRIVKILKDDILSIVNPAKTARSHKAFVFSAMGLFLWAVRSKVRGQ